MCEVQTDKATTDISSRYSGEVVKLCYQKGEMAKVGTPLVFLRTKNAAATTAAAPAAPAASAATAAAAAPAASSAVAAAPAGESAVLGSDGKVLATPAVRRIAKESGVNLAVVTGSGKDGRVMKEDVIRFLNGAQPAAATTAAAVTAPQPSAISVSSAAYVVLCCCVFSLHSALAVFVFLSRHEVRINYDF